MHLKRLHADPANLSIDSRLTDLGVWTNFLPCCHFGRASLIQVMSTFRHLTISRHVFFVTTPPKQSVKSETLLISSTIDVFRTSIRRHKACAPYLSHYGPSERRDELSHGSADDFSLPRDFPVHMKS